MTLCDELYFEITLHGKKDELKRFVTFLKSGDLDDFFEISSEYINYEDDYFTGDNNSLATVIFSNDDYGISIDEFDTDEFLEVFCKAAKPLFVQGVLYDADDEEYEFESAAGDSYYINAKRRFSDLVDDEEFSSTEEEQ
jgi:hypothetical protein